MNSIPRPEYPRPQFVRPTWMNLNGLWQFEIDHGASGRARGLVQKEQLEQTILVPFWKARASALWCGRLQV